MTNGLAIVTLVLFVLVWGLGQIDYAAAAGGFIPARLSSPGAFVHSVGAFVVPVWLTPLTATLIHGGWMHIGFNMLMLVFCGRHVEHVLGPRLLLVLYVIGAYAAAAAEWVLNPSSLSPMVGASGAISALLGTYALMYSHQKVRAIGPFSANFVRIAWLAAGWTAIQLMIGLATVGGTGDLGEDIGQIAIGAHIGGFIAGLMLTRPILHLRFRRGPAGLNNF
ncbi:rhomboid family intramembrane serine protease [Sphingobium sp. SCG-1]|uniref:rhomboid family intramembrane serine protease n=1 Tax=Sphingobium sp. SCG-1 TaxID=2072936 RepID=UPI000CD690C7|nr:rhomboid family intramembrane serine protease [Sphingobium sp. SCG-1]AUW59130.1 rhomboid family intramembrane serine protease [Sphingobium sp. SCG-1]